MGDLAEPRDVQQQLEERAKGHEEYQAEAIISLLSSVCDVEMWPGPGLCTGAPLEKGIADADAVLSNVRWTAELMDKAPKLRLIALNSVGFDSIDVAAATKRGVIVTNTPDVLTETTADTAFCLLVAVARRIGELERHVRARKWAAFPAQEGLLGTDIHHATLGIVGFGRIGTAVAHRARGFHMRVLYSDEIRRRDLEEQFGYTYVDLDTLLRESDFVTLHVPLSERTRHLIGAAELAKMKPTAFLVNASRGAAIDERALIGALREKRIAGAGLDVFETEPIEPDNPLLEMENVVLAPHMGSGTAATRDAMFNLAAQNVVAVMQGRPPLTPVNPEVLTRNRQQDQ